MDIIIFAEEYKKLTKGTFLVWSSYVKEASKKHKLTIILNKEHWCYDQVSRYFKSNSNVLIKKIKFSIVSVILEKYLLRFQNKTLKIIILMILKFLDILYFPIIIYKLIITLKLENKKNLISHNGGLPGSPLCRYIMIASYILNFKNRIFVVHSHPVPKYKNSLFFLNLISWFQNKILDLCSTKIVTVSNSVKRELKKLGFNTEIFFVHNGIQNKQNKVSMSKINCKQKKIIVGFIGTLSYEKGVHVLINSFQYVTKPCVELVLVGPIDENFLPYLKSLAKKCKNKVSFLGYTDNVQNVISKLDILVVPAIAYESFSMVILEAMTKKIPVICSDFGGMKEVVIHNKTGLIVPSNDICALSKAINKLIKRKSIRQEMGIMGYKRYLNKFTSKHMEAGYDKLLN